MKLFGIVDNITDSSVGGWVCAETDCIADKEVQIKVTLFFGDKPIAETIAATQRDDLKHLKGLARAFSIQIEKSLWSSLDLLLLRAQATFGEETCLLSIWRPLELALKGNALPPSEYHFFNVFNSKLSEHLTEDYCPYLYGGLVFSQNSILPCCEVGGDCNASMPELISDLKQKQFNQFATENDCNNALTLIHESRLRLIDLFKQGDLKKCQGCLRVERRRSTEVSHITLINMMNFAHFTNCQLKCTYCYTNNLTHPEYATYNVFALVNHLIKLQLVSDEAEIIWTGGEPTIQRHFGNMLDLFDFVNKKQLIASNCVHFSCELHELLTLEKAKLVCSLDAGSSTLYNKIHRKDCFKQVVQNLIKYISSGGDVVLKYVLIDSNKSKKSIDDFLQLAKQIGGREVCIVPDFARVPEKDNYLPASAHFTTRAVELDLLPTIACVSEEFRNRVKEF